MIVRVEEAEYARLLGYPWGTVLEGDVLERAEQAAEWYAHNCNPQVYCVTVASPVESEGRKESEIPLLGKGGVAAPTKKLPRSDLSGRRRGGSFNLHDNFLNEPPRPRPSKEPAENFIDGASTPPPPRRGILSSLLIAVQQITVAAISAGLEVDIAVERLWGEDRVDEAYFLDRYAAGVVETYESPGTGRIPFEEQWTLFSYVAPLNPDIKILPSGMLSPRNSLLAVVRADSRATANPCTRCDLAGCSFRRRPA
jgi:hypothetical protein